MVGFFVAVWTLRRAGAARDAAVAVRNRLTQVYTLADIVSVVANIEEIKRLHRATASLEILLDRYSTVRQRLVSIGGSSVVKVNRQDGLVISAIGQFRTMEQEVEKAQSKRNRIDLDFGRFNDIASKILDDLNGVMISIRQAAE